MLRYDPAGERATRDIVSRAIFAEMRAGRTTPNGGVYIQMQHLGVARVRREFKGMVERCADCGFDLAGGLVEVVPTAHYMMGGVQFAADCTTALAGLFAAGEDTGGVHGANRLGGNGVANSTVFGGIAGESMAAWLRHDATARAPRVPDEAAIVRAIDRHEMPFRIPPGDVAGVRDRLLDLMWNDVGILRDARGLASALSSLDALEADLARTGVDGSVREYNVSWHDWLNLANLIAVSKVIATAALARENSRGAHFREDFPDSGDLATSSYTVVSADAGGRIAVRHEPVQFTRVKPGESLLREAGDVLTAA
jgi:fumarate reductase flavoprotein subunit